MTARRRRGLQLALLSLVLLGIGVADLAAFVDDVNRRVGPQVPVLRLRRDVEAFDPVTTADVEVVQVPERWAPARALAGPAGLADRVAGVALHAGTDLTTDVLAPRPELAPGDREIAILVDAATGVAGKVAPGARVDIVATFAGEDGAEDRSQVIVAAARVLEVGELRSGVDDEGFDAGRVVPVTFALGLEESLTLTYAESFATRVRLALLAPDDRAPAPIDERTVPAPGSSGSPTSTGADEEPGR